MFYLPSADAAQTLPKEQSVAKPSPDQLKVNPTAWWFLFLYRVAPSLYLCMVDCQNFFVVPAPHLPERKKKTQKQSPKIKSSWSPQSRDRVTLLCSPRDRVPVSERVSLGCSTSRPQLLQPAPCFSCFSPFYPTLSPSRNCQIIH